MIAITQGIAVHGISLRPNRTLAAWTHADHASSVARGKVATLAAIRKDIAVALAGPHAQMRLRDDGLARLFDGESIAARPEWHGDLEMAGELILSAAAIEFGDAERIDERVIAFNRRLMRCCDASAGRLVAKHWPAITSVADALLRRPVLTAADLDKLVGGAR